MTSEIAARSSTLPEPARRGARLPISVRAGLALASLIVCMAAHGANPSDWWVDINNDRAKEVKAMLAGGADPNEISPDGQPAIMQAIREGAWDVYEVLLNDQHTVLNAINIYRETPLMYLSVLGETARAQDLIRRGALVNRLGWTPLQYAASKGHLETVKMLVANKAIVNAPAPDGTTALMMAAYGGSEAVVRYLLDQGADVTMQNLNKWDAAQWARHKNHTSLARKLDDIATQVQASRNAQQQGRGTDSSPAEPILPGAVTQGETGKSGATSANQPSPAGQDAEVTEPGKSSTSRYFDLERFDQPVEP